MFKQFTQNINGHQIYLLSSLGIFLVFFIVVTIILFRLGKNHVDQMSALPLSDNDVDPSKNLL
jgi:cbb3-type cytochrome oxidase subunit 3